MKDNLEHFEINELEELLKYMEDPIGGLIKDYGRLAGIKAKFTLFDIPIYIREIGNRKEYLSEDTTRELLYKIQKMCTENDNIFLEKGGDLRDFDKYDLRTKNEVDFKWH